MCSSSIFIRSAAQSCSTVFLDSLLLSEDAVAMRTCTIGVSMATTNPNINDNVDEDFINSGPAISRGVLLRGTNRTAFSLLNIS